MKKILFVITLLVLIGIVSAESEQVVYYDSNRVLESCKDLQDAQKNLSNDIAAWEQEIQEIDMDIAALKEEYELKKITLLESGKEEALQKIKDLEQDRKAKVEEIYGEGGKIINRNDELLSPIMEKLNLILEKIAVDNNYSMILDAASGAVGYAKSKLDITDDIIDEMEETYDTEELENK